MTAQFGPHRWSAGDRTSAETDAFRGARFEVADLRGTTFVDCDLTGAKIIDACLVDVDVSGYVSNLVVNGVDVTGYVEAELDRRHPERVQLRGLRSAAGFRAMWDTVEHLWSATLTRAARLPAAALSERVAGQWSLIETLRHLIFITDSWAARTILDEPRPYHRLGLPQTAYRRADAEALGMEVTASPSFDEVLRARTSRMSVVRGIVDTLADTDLGRPCARSPAPGYPEGDRSVGECLGVVMEEECEHHRFATRDLDTLERRSP